MTNQTFTPTPTVDAKLIATYRCLEDVRRQARALAAVLIDEVSFEIAGVYGPNAMLVVEGFESKGGLITLGADGITKDGAIDLKSIRVRLTKREEEIEGKIVELEAELLAPSE
ncbi:hypothetical protein [Lysinibacter cavernae]|uniref:hypothetical protein n=1 Tax=Lysinibacter cavernae TaxID=1640652 RepID=UPI003618779A